MFFAHVQSDSGVVFKCFSASQQSHCILSPYHSIDHLLQKSEAFQLVHHVTFILCYNVLSDFLVSVAALRSTAVGSEQRSTRPLVPLSEFVNTDETI